MPVQLTRTNGGTPKVTFEAARILLPETARRGVTAAANVTKKTILAGSPARLRGVALRGFAFYPLDQRVRHRQRERMIEHCQRLLRRSGSDAIGRGGGIVRQIEIGQPVNQRGARVLMIDRAAISFRPVLI